jgi:hypothetical protein
MSGAGERELRRVGQAAKPGLVLQRHATPAPAEVDVAKQKTQAHVIRLISMWMCGLPRGRLEGRDMADLSSVVLP